MLQTPGLQGAYLTNQLQEVLPIAVLSLLVELLLMCIPLPLPALLLPSPSFAIILPLGTSLSLLVVAILVCWLQVTLAVQVYKVLPVQGLFSRAALKFWKAS